MNKSKPQYEGYKKFECQENWIFEMRVFYPFGIFFKFRMKFSILSLFSKRIRDKFWSFRWSFGVVSVRTNSKNSFWGKRLQNVNSNFLLTNFSSKKYCDLQDIWISRETTISMLRGFKTIPEILFSSYWTEKKDFSIIERTSMGKTEIEVFFVNLNWGLDFLIFRGFKASELLRVQKSCLNFQRKKFNWEKDHKFTFLFE